MARVDVRPEVLTWAVARSGLSDATLAKRFPKLGQWIERSATPTLRQLERFATATFTSVGYLLLDAPPAESLPIPDFRTVADRQISRPSPHLLDTVYLCQQRQDWFRDFVRTQGETPLAVVGSARVGDDVVETAARIRETVGFNLAERRRMGTWEEALRRFIQKVDELGILVMVSGVVGSNTRRRLDPQEFRGFALADDRAPLIFVNGADSKAAQMFTLAHELAHIWIGQSGVSDATAFAASDHRTEHWCNRVAAELLVPMAALRQARVRALPKGSGGDFYLTLGARASKTFSRAIVSNTLEGATSFTEAFRLLGFRKAETFHEAARQFGLRA